MILADASAQVVQLPTVGSFNISTTVAAPDRGSASLGGVGGGAWGSRSAGGLPSMRSSGGRGGFSAASVYTTIIDLDELDRMIRSQASKRPGEPKLGTDPPRASMFTPPSVRSRLQSADYDYIMALSGHGESVEAYDPDQTKYYLALAERARHSGHWASVEVYYRLAWQSLPEGRRDSALVALAKARSHEPSLEDKSNPATTTDRNPPSRTSTR